MTVGKPHAERTLALAAAAAYRDLCAAIREQLTLSDDALEALLDEEPDPASRKRLVSGLLGHGLVTADQAAMQVYLRPELRGA